MLSIKATTTGVITTAPFSVSLLTWTGAGSAGDSLVVQDNSGRDIWRATAPASNYDLSISFGSANTAVFNGINVITLGSGTLTIYYQ